MFVKCSCAHEYQDQMYGKQVRSANPVNKSKVVGKLQAVRCTVCRSIHKEWKDKA